jgi:hypothetical protein
MSKINEWGLLKLQFDALTHDESVEAGSIEEIFDMPSRAAATRELLKRGLTAEGFEASPFGVKSEEYGVTGADPKGRKTK